MLGAILFPLLCAGAILIGHSQPERSDFFSYFGDCGGIPCYLGVVPGQTNWDSALTTFESKPELAYSPQTNTAFNPPGFQGSALLYSLPEQNLVEEIDLTMRSTNVSFGSLLQRFGDPCGVQVSGNSGLSIVFLRMIVAVYADKLGADQVLQPTTPVYSMSLFNRFQSCEQIMSSIAAAPWKGFVRYTS
ncbi:MAG TPA: hypothetical protein VHD90_08965 [Phototrophicaceae bacterium]|nr:hypothetical protein [Phototrophicaceae bacterium]